VEAVIVLRAITAEEAALPVVMAAEVVHAATAVAAEAITVGVEAEEATRAVVEAADRIAAVVVEEVRTEVEVAIRTANPAKDHWHAI